MSSVSAIGKGQVAIPKRAREALGVAPRAGWSSTWKAAARLRLARADGASRIESGR